MSLTHDFEAVTQAGVVQATFGSLELALIHVEANLETFPGLYVRKVTTRKTVTVVYVPGVERRAA